MFELSRLVFPLLIIVAGVATVREVEDDRFHKTEIKVVGYDGRTKEIRKAERNSRKAAARYRRDCKRAERIAQEDNGGDSE